MRDVEALWAASQWPGPGVLKAGSGPTQVGPLSSFLLTPGPQASQGVGGE